MDRDHGNSAGAVLPFELTLKEVHDNYLVCQRRMDGEWVGPAYNVARSAITRKQEYDGETFTDPVDGDDWTYTYTGTQERTVQKGSDSEDQVIVPRLIPDHSSILVMPCAAIVLLDDDGETNVHCGLVEIPQGRAFAKKAE